MSETHPPPLWGVSAEFETAAAMVSALEHLRERGLGRLDAFSPIPVPGAAEALRVPRGHFSWFAAAGAVLGGIAMMGMCLYATVVSYRFDIGGRPLVSWPAFVIPSFSFAMLCGALTVMTAFLVLNRMPRLNHPAFNIPDFGRVTEDRFFVVVEARDQTFDADAVERGLAALQPPPHRISRVPR